MEEQVNAKINEETKEQTHDKAFKADVNGLCTDQNEESHNQGNVQVTGNMLEPQALDIVQEIQDI